MGKYGGRDQASFGAVSIFQAPEAILTDRGSMFREKEFQEYVTQELCAYQIFTSAYYPQRNGVNEASHKGIEASIAAVAESADVSFADALKDAVAVHNATPHSALGESPFKAMFGLEPTLPGWQRYRRGGDLQTLRATRQSNGPSYVRVQLLHDRRQLQQKLVVEVNDIIVYQMAEGERANSRSPTSTSGVHAAMVAPLPCYRGQGGNSGMRDDGLPRVCSSGTEGQDTRAQRVYPRKPSPVEPYTH